MAQLSVCEDTVCQPLLSRIQHFLLTNDHEGCVSFCFAVIKELPQVLPVFQNDLTLAMRNWGEDVADDDSQGITKLLDYYHKAVYIYSDNKLLQNNMAGFLFKVGYPKEAIHHLRQVLFQNPDFLKARENLDNIYGFLVERWHFRMLNDLQRNLCYRSAIQEAIHQLPTEKPLVLDIGTGTGLLSMFAALTYDTVEVYGCEMSPTMYEICCNVLSANNLSDCVKVIDKMSETLSVPHHIPHKADLVITETFDCAFFGEHILSSLSHAWDNLMKENCCVVPTKATVYMAAVECDAVHRQNRLLYRNLDCVDLSSVDILCITGSEDLSKHYFSRMTKQCADTMILKPEGMNFESYSSEFLKYLPGGFKWLSHSLVLTEFHLDNPEQVKLFSNGIKKSVELEVMNNGRLDAFIVWFDLHVSKELVLTTAVASDDDASLQGCCQAVCWEQAVFPFLSNHLDPTNVKFSEDVNVFWGNKLLIDMAISSCLHLTCRQIVKPNRTLSISTVNSMQVSFCTADNITTETLDENITDPAAFETQDSKDVSVMETCSIIQNVIPRVVLFAERIYLAAINNQVYHEVCFKALRKVKDHCESHNTNLRLVTMQLGMSFLPIQALKLSSDKVMVIGANATEQSFLQQLLKHNGFYSNQLLFNNGTNVEVDNSWNVIFADTVDAYGCMRENILREIALIRDSRLLSGGIILPNRVLVYGRLINSWALMENTKVINDERTLLCNVAASMNEYQTCGHFGFELSTLDYTPVTEVFQMFSFDLNSDQFYADSFSLHNWRFYENTFQLNALKTTSITSLVYWFELNLIEDVSINTLDERCNWKQAAIMIPNAPSVKSGDCIDMRVVFSDSYFNVELKINKNSTSC